MVNDGGVKEIIILTLVKGGGNKNPLFRTVVIDVKALWQGREIYLTPDTAKTTEDLQPMSRKRESVDGRLLREGNKCRGILAKQT